VAGAGCCALVFDWQPDVRSMWHMSLTLSSQVCRATRKSINAWSAGRPIVEVEAQSPDALSASVCVIFVSSVIATECSK
jgi:hypothetical protein